MNNNKRIVTKRLILEPISLDDSEFIFELVNTQGWIKFIGDKQIHSYSDALTYVKSIIQDESKLYWTIKLNDVGTEIGIVTFMKKDYLEFNDIGFALLPAFWGRGYAYEASNSVLAFLSNQYALPTIFATVLPDNSTSIKLLEKLGFSFCKIIQNQGKELYIYHGETRNF